MTFNDNKSNDNNKLQLLMWFKGKCKRRGRKDVWSELLQQAGSQSTCLQSPAFAPCERAKSWNLLQPSTRHLCRIIQQSPPSAHLSSQSSRDGDVADNPPPGDASPPTDCVQLLLPEEMDQAAVVKSKRDGSVGAELRPQGCWEARLKTLTHGEMSLKGCCCCLANTWH